MSDVATELARSGSRGASLGFAFDLLLKTLPSAMASRIRLVAIPHEFDPEIVRVLEPSLKESEAFEACQRLAKLSMVRKLSGSLALHDEARQYLFRDWLRPEREEEFRAISNRLATLFGVANQELRDERFATRRNRSLFHLIGADAERGFLSLQAACNAERRNGRLAECQTLINLAREYDPVLTEQQRILLAYEQGRLAADVRDWDVAVEQLSAVAANERSAPLLRVKARQWMGIVERERRRLDESISVLKSAVEQAKVTPGCIEEVDDALRELAVSYREAGDLDRAEELLKESIGRAIKTNDQHSLAAGWNSLGALYSRQRMGSEAVKAFTNAASLLRDETDRALIAQLKNNLAMAYVDTGDLMKGESLLVESLEMKRAIGDTRGQAVTLGNLADVYARLGRGTEALDKCMTSVRAFQSVRDDFSAATVARNLGRALRKAHSFDDARLSFAMAVELFQASGQDAAVQATQREIDRLGAKVRIPWWAWVIIVAPIVAIVAFLVFVESLPTTNRQLPALVPPSSGFEDVALDSGEFQTTFAVPYQSAWFRFSVPKGPFTIRATGGIGDTVIFVYRAEPFTLVGLDDDGGEGLSSMLELNPGAGIYYLEVREYSQISVPFWVSVSSGSKDR